jgi:hypothetical protein
MPRKKKIHGYDGPTGAYAVVGGRTVSLATDPAGLLALTDAALLTGLGFSEKAAEYRDLAERRNTTVTA